MKTFEIDESVLEKYKGYPLSVVLYHLYDLTSEDYKKYSDSELNEYISHCRLARAVILSRMSEEEYEELQRSLRGHVVQLRIAVSKNYKFVKSIYDPEKIEVIKRYMESAADSDDPLPISNE